jgi:Zn-dependent protease with chaperone function
MRMILAALGAIALATMTLGCATSPRAAAELWVDNHGGVLAAKSTAQARIETVAQPLLAACRGRRISVRVLASDAVTAYSMRDGHVFVTRGLMDRLDDAELQAAVAHELGHLLSDGHLQTVASLRGCCVDPDCEVRADAAGAQLLRAQGLSPLAMQRMLRKVERFGSLPPSCAVEIRHRIARLTTAASSGDLAQN